MGSGIILLLINDTILQWRVKKISKWTASSKRAPSCCTYANISENCVFAYCFLEHG